MTCEWPILRWKASWRTPAYNEYFNTDGSKATPLFDGSFGCCFRSQAARQWSGVCISVTLRLVYRHLLRRPRRSSANTVARHTLPSIVLVCVVESPPPKAIRIGLLSRGIVWTADGEKKGPVKKRQWKRRVTSCADRSAAISEYDEPSWRAHRSMSDQTSLFDMRLYCPADRSSRGQILVLIPQQRRPRLSRDALVILFECRCSLRLITESSTLVAHDVRSIE